MNRQISGGGSPPRASRPRLLELPPSASSGGSGSSEGGLRLRKGLAGGGESSSGFGTLAGTTIGNPSKTLTRQVSPSTEPELVQSQFQDEVTICAAAMLQTEHVKEQRLSSVTVKCICLMVLAILAIGASLVYLRSVFVPFVLALFFMFVLEPLMLGLLNPPALCPQRARPKWIQTLALNIDAARRDAQAERPHESSAESCATMTSNLLWRSLMMVWTGFAVIVSIIFLMTFIGILVYLCIKEIENFDVSKYLSSQRFAKALTWFPSLGSDPKAFNWEKVAQLLLNGPLFQVLDMTLSFISGALLTILFLAFLLIFDADLGRPKYSTFASKVRNSVRRYIQMKTLVSIVVSFSSGLCYWLWEVDLWVCFSLATFVLYYIPHVGDTIAILAPLPLVCLDPTKTTAGLICVGAIPFGIHQLATNVIDPKLLGDQLDLHPITVLFSLVFWTVMWGPVGSVLSVPLTAVVRLMLIELNHPYLTPIVHILKGELQNLNVNSEAP